MTQSRTPVWHRFWIALWLLVLLASGMYCGERIIRGAAFESNILGLIPPQDEGQMNLHTGITKDFEKRFVILLSHPDPGQGTALAKALKMQLAQQSLLSMDSADQSTLAGLGDFFKPYRHQLLAAQMREKLQHKDVESLATTVVNDLYNPVSGFRLYPFADDPFNLGGAWLQSVFPEAARFRGTDIPSLQTDGRTWHLISGQVQGSPFDLANQQALSTVLDDFGAQPGQQENGTTLLFSGLVFHATEASRIARFEISTVGSGSLLGIFLLVTMVFRSRRALTAIAFTLASSTLLALAITFAVFERVHLVTLALGTTLLGLAVDYCFHFLIKYRVNADALVAGRLIRKGLLISAGTSIAAYLIQLFSPFPGLQQLAVFIAAGLVGACGAVLVLSLCFHEMPSPGFKRWLGFFPARVQPAYARLSNYRAPLYCLLVALLPLLAAYLYWQGNNDDIRLLNTSSQNLLDSERQVQQLLGGIDPQRYWVVEGDDQQQILERTEMLVAVIDDGNANPASVQAITAMVPSLATQKADHTLIAAKLYGPDGALVVMCARLQSDCSWQSLPADFNEDLIPARIPTALASQFPPLALTDKHHTIVLQRQGTALSQQSLDSLAQMPGVTYVDQVQGLSATLAAFRAEVSILLGVFLAVFALACLVFYDRRGLVVLVCVLVSMLGSLALSSSGGATLFHILALLLVMGLTVDTAVFYLELGLDGETWLASTLASLTSILAFGLLALSQVPLLHHFGSVVFFGLLCAWLITPLLFQLAGGNPIPAHTGCKS